MQKQLTPEQRKQRTETILKLVGVGVVGFIVAPFVLQAIGGIIGLAIAAALGFVGINMTQWFALKVANWRLKAIKAEAMKNPVETLQTEYDKKVRALEEYKENIRIFAGQVLSFADQVKQYCKEGLEDCEVYKEQLTKMKRLLELRQQKYQEAQDSLAEFWETIKRTERKWKMACAAMAMNEAAGQIEGDVFDKICIETALDSVQSKLNQSFADLEIALLDDDKQKQKKLADKQAPLQIADRQETIPSVIDVEAVPVRRQRMS